MGTHLLILIGLFLIPALLAVFTFDLLRAAIALLVCSVGLTLLLFDLNAPWAAVFELSVCAGLITVLFINTISLSRVLTPEERSERKEEHYQRFAWMLVVVLVAGTMLWFNLGRWNVAFPLAHVKETRTVGEILWNVRGLDLIGQVAIMLVGVYGVVVLFRRGKNNG
ncbi:NADH-quinone oxidoreductase subunit J [Hydrogenispora ethanolica]|uniref:NADH-quinone oxidoreductase subunit J n=1 Tax=Hydrogenispora ethanolica TaxID=1082276 RepID=A0A4R1R6E6_HYDET|nr:NADH-quinone oxidoreductase subunit J [Hydrogenispora ethanolica]TCL60892.1 NADH-quinone oxidoreductase subunit J [Hydrogenispora ethanolica]